MRRTCALGALAVLVPLVGCGESEKSPEQAREELAEICATARDALRDAPTPVDDASQEEFRAAADEHITQAGYDLFDLDEHFEFAEEPDLDELTKQVQGFPRLIGAWTEKELAWRSRAAVVRIDELAADLGVPECAAETWRMDGWIAYTEAVNPDPSSAEEFSAELSALCARTIGEFSFSGEVGTLGDVMTAGNAERAITEFRLDMGTLTPPPDLAEEYVEVLVPVAMLDATPRIPDAVERLDEAINRLSDALDDLIDDC